MSIIKPEDLSYAAIKEPHAPTIASTVPVGCTAYITITKGISGYFAVHMWMNTEDYPNDISFWEPYDTGFGRYPTYQQAEMEALQWAAEEGLPFVKGSC